MGKPVKCNNCGTEYDLDIDNKCPKCGSNNFSRKSFKKSLDDTADD